MASSGSQASPPSAQAAGTAPVPTTKPYSFDELMFKYGKEALEQLSLKPGHKLLDVACGTGALAAFAAESCGAIVDAVDFSPAMIEQLRQRLVLTPTTVCPHVMDGQALNFADNTFDAAVSCFGVMNFPNHAQGLREMHRVLRPGGHVAVVSWRTLSETVMGPLMAMLAEEFPEVSEFQRPASWVSLSTEEGMASELQAVGFCSVGTQDVAFPHEVTSARELVLDGFAPNPAVQKMLDGYACDHDELLRRLVQRLESEHAAGTFEIPTRGLIGLGVKP